jgi:IclR family acetate operon transcriptional repressor
MSQSPAQFAIRTLRAIEVLAFNASTASELADALLVHPRAARRLLSQLQRDGWLSYTKGPGERVYAPTLRFVALAAQIGARAPLVTVAEPALQQLYATTGHPAALAIAGYDATICVVRCVASYATQAMVPMVAPVHCTALGKVLLAHRDAWRRTVLGRPLQRCTERTMTDPGALDAELSRVRHAGYAVEDGEHIDDFRALAAPVAGPNGPVLAAIAITVWDRGSLDEHIDEVCAAADVVSEAVGAAVERYALEPRIVYRLLASYGLDPVDAYL